MRFDWDAANTEHIARHGVTPVEFIQAFYKSPVHIKTAIIKGEERHMFAGQTTAGRVLRLVWTLRNGMIRPVTAHESAKHRNLFE